MQQQIDIQSCIQTAFSTNRPRTTINKTHKFKASVPARNLKPTGFLVCPFIINWLKVSPIFFIAVFDMAKTSNITVCKLKNLPELNRKGLIRYEWDDTSVPVSIFTKIFLNSLFISTAKIQLIFKLAKLFPKIRASIYFFVLKMDFPTTFFLFPAGVTDFFHLQFSLWAPYCCLSPATRSTMQEHRFRFRRPMLQCNTANLHLVQCNRQLTG